MQELFKGLGHKFEIGSVVAAKGSATESEPGKFMGSSGEMRYVVVEQVASRCHGGVQLFYTVRGVGRSGTFTTDYLRFCEVELEASESFRRRPAADE